MPHQQDDPSMAARPETGAMTSALIVDDHPLFCDALAMTLKTMLAFSHIRVAGSLRAATETLERDGAPDVIMLDLNLPDVTGLDGLVRLVKTAPRSPVIVVSSITDPKIVRLAVRAGARGYVPKHSKPEIFRRALDHVAAGGVFDEAAGDPPAPDAQESSFERLSLLTLQQARILKLVCEGKLNKQIAYDLSIAETTVKTHMTAIMRKLGASSRTQAVLIAQQGNFAQLLNLGERPE